MRPLVLHFSPGCDLVNAVTAFARLRLTGLSVLTGSGVSPTSHSATPPPCQPPSPSTAATTFSPSPALSSSPTSRPVLPPLLPPPNPSLHQFLWTVSLAGGQSQVIGESVVGSLLTAGPVVLVAASVLSPALHRIPADDSEDDQITGVLQHDMEQGTPPPAGAGGHCAGPDSSHNRSSSNMSVVCAGHATVHNPIPLACQLSPDTLPAWAATSRP